MTPSSPSFGPISLAALNAAAAFLGNFRDGRKAILFVSQGIALGPGQTDRYTEIVRTANTNNTAIYTAPGTNPAYVMTEVTIVGTGGVTVAGVGEAVIRTRFEGMTRDEAQDTCRAMKARRLACQVMPG